MENNEQIRLRIEQLVTKSGLSINAFAKKAGVDQASLNKILKGSLGISPKMINAIAAITDSDPQWIMFGEPKSAHSFFLPSRPLPAQNHGQEMRRHYFQLANAGTLSEEEGSSYEMQPVIQQMPSYDFTIEIHGDSMSPTYNSGDIVACRNVTNSSFLQWGQIHVLSTSQGNIIKRIFEKEGGIDCRSDNKDYPPFFVPEDEVYSIGLVVGGLKKEHI